MSLQPSNAARQTKRSKLFVSILFRGLGLLLCAVIVILFGLIPFSLGAFIQAISPRRIPSFVVGVIAAGAFFALQYFAGGVSVTAGDGFPVWPSVLLKLILFIAFFASGTALFCELFPRRVRRIARAHLK